ncbi:MAG: hypothetical protein Q8M02_10110 [Candidatus Didemnitutus sp.]|nr:hypothetical protein [Candidatus Didemnitutus sp.]
MNEKELEQFIHTQLRALPLRRAPRTLENRVLAAIEQRAAIAWWHKSWNFWPTPVRAIFAALMTLLAGSVMAGAYALTAGADTSAALAAVGDKLSVVVKLYHAAAWVADYVSFLIGSIPPLWLYGGLAFAAIMYAALFGLGAAAYRTLYRSN